MLNTFFFKCQNLSTSVCRIILLNSWTWCFRNNSILLIENVFTLFFFQFCSPSNSKVFFNKSSDLGIVFVHNGHLYVIVGVRADVCNVTLICRFIDTNVYISSTYLSHVSEKIHIHMHKLKNWKSVCLTRLFQNFHMSVFMWRYLRVLVSVPTNEQNDVIKCERYQLISNLCVTFRNDLHRLRSSYYVKINVSNPTCLQITFNWDLSYIRFSENVFGHDAWRKIFIL